MKPGRELDALVAEKVMSIPVKQLLAEPGWEGLDTLYSKVRIPQYSTSIADAWKVVEKLSVMGIYLRVSNVTGVGRWRCATENQITDFCETAPHAICLAALKSCGGGGMKHVWWTWLSRTGNLVCCVQCGNIRRADGLSDTKECRGPVGISLR